MKQYKHSKSSNILISSGSKVLSLYNNNDNRIAAIVIYTSDSTQLAELAKMNIHKTGSLLNISPSSQNGDFCLDIQ